MMNKTKRALADAGISSMTAKEALGRGQGPQEGEGQREHRVLELNHLQRQNEPAPEGGGGCSCHEAR